MSEQDRERYERSCLEEFERALQGDERKTDRFHNVKEARLIGSYPETALYVRWGDTRHAKEREREFKLWINPVTGGPPGSFEYEGSENAGREPPDQVVMLIRTWIGES